MAVAGIITIGDELLYGQTLDTNSHFISGALSDAGYKTVLKMSVGDNAPDIVRALNICSENTDIILISGGLGPTRDDITKKTLAGYFGTGLVLNEEALEDVTEFFRKRGITLSDINRQQAYLPGNSQVVRNIMGTAPGMWIERNGKIYISMPGVPHELENMVIAEVIPRLKRKFPPPVIIHQYIMTTGIGESVLAEMIRDWEISLPSNIRLAYLPGFGQVKLRMTGIGDDPKGLDSEIHMKMKELEPLIGRYIYGYENEGLEKKIGDILRERNMTLSLAESCTGGHLAHTITSVPGSSDYFLGGIVAYHNSVKENQLFVKKETLANFGAVSEQTVREMAEGAREKFGTDISLATSGIAGPGGGTPEKPVGLVWMAINDSEGTDVKKVLFSKNRITNIQYATISGLTFLWQRLKAISG